MLKSVTCLVGSAAMLAHALLGCCWHHSHAPIHESHASIVDTEAGGATTSPHQCTANRHHGFHPGDSAHLAGTAVFLAAPIKSDEHRGHDHGPCEEVKCEFVGSSKVEPLSCQTHVPSKSLPHAPAGLSLPDGSHFSRFRERSARFPWQPDRGLTQVWLL